MANNVNQALAQREAASEGGGAASLQSVLERNCADQIRREIGIVAACSLRERVINQQAHHEYQELAQGRETHEISAEMLERTRTFAVEHERRAIRVYRKIQAARREQIASEVDEDFLMEKLVVENMDFLRRADEVEALIDGKLQRMRDDKKAYDAIAHHPLVENVGYLKADPYTKINVPDEAEFLAMTVPERRELLENLQAVLPKAEAYAEEADKGAAKEMTDAYRGLLDEAMERKIIGKKTYDKFLDGFEKQDRAEMEEWLAEFGPQMERYEDLWGQIRETLQGEALDEIEGKIDSKGYAELLSEFGRLKSYETARLSTSYRAALETYRRTPDNLDGIIGKHTVGEFMMWMNAQPLSQKYGAEDQLPEQMVRYEKLWEEAGELKGKERAFLWSKIDVWGYTELHGQLQAFQRGEGLSATLQANKKDPLSSIQSQEAKDAIIDVNDTLTEAGATRKHAFMRILDRAFAGVRRDEFDSKSFERGLEIRRQLVAKQAAEETQNSQPVDWEVANDNASEMPQVTIPPINPANDLFLDLEDDEDLSVEADDEVDGYEVERDLALLEAQGGVDVSEGDGFIQVEATRVFDNNDLNGRAIHAVVNRDESMDRLLGAEEIRGVEGDELSLAFDAGPRTVEFQYNEIMALQHYLETTEQETANDNVYGIQAANDNAYMDQAA